MRMNQRMSELLREFPVTDLKDEDIPPVFLEVKREGWFYTPNGPGYSESLSQMPPHPTSMCSRKKHRSMVEE